MTGALRLAFPPLVSAALLVAAAPLDADWLVLKDGNRIETSGPWREKGRQIVFTLPNGQLAALRATEVDLSASRAASAATPVTPAGARFPTVEMPAEPESRVEFVAQLRRFILDKSIPRAHGTVSTVREASLFESLAADNPDYDDARRRAVEQYGENAVSAAERYVEIRMTGERDCREENGDGGPALAACLTNLEAQQRAEIEAVQQALAAQQIPPAEP
ncbi:MAG: hypothetical protein U0X73_00565 [Thermoanaerobaculia bacterium]